MVKTISILGSTGSIGVNALEVISNLEKCFTVRYLSTYKNVDLLVSQIKKHKPKAVAVVDETAAKKIKSTLDAMGIKLLTGRVGLLDLSQRNDLDLMLNGLVGASGMQPTINAIKAGVNVALANKESLVMAGNIINKELKNSEAKLFPVDSEHSAIWQCMVGEKLDDINRIILTGSGGPFRERPLSTFSKITKNEALDHPNWDMGDKISIDSATMMDKGLEVIEAYWLFGFGLDKIDIVVHPQSIIHSMIEMNDGSIKAQMGVPDMKVPIQYALTYPEHVFAKWDRLDFYKCGDLTFQPPDFERFPSISLAFRALDLLGTAGTALNLANDITVDLFLKEKILFTDIPRINEIIIEEHPWVEEPTLDDITNLEEWVKEKIDNF